MLCFATAVLLFLPHCIIDAVAGGGYFHYAGDFNDQQINFYQYANAFIKQGGTFSWATDLGSGFVNSYSFYLLGSPFFWLSMLVPAKFMPWAMVPLLCLKMALAGGGAYLWARRWVQDERWSMLAGCLYAFSGFSIYNIFFNHFLDVVALFPYILASLDDAVLDGKKGRFPFWVALNLVNNYFFFAGQAVFLILYFFCMAAGRRYKIGPRKFASLAWETVLGCACGCVLLLPAGLSLLQNPRTIDPFTGYGYLFYGKSQQYGAIFYSPFLMPDAPYFKDMFQEGILKHTSLTAYLPLVGAAGGLAFCRARGRHPFTYILKVCIVCAFVPVLNSAFYALNSSYYARWYYMPVLILCAMTACALEVPDTDLDAPARGIGWLMVATLAFAVVPVQDTESGSWSFGVLQNPGQFAAVFAFGLGGLLVYRFLCGRWRGQKVFARRLLAATLAFACAFSVVHIGIGKFGQWNTDSDLVEEYTNALKLKEDLPAGDWRVDTYKTHDNLGLWLDKSCLQYFGSTAAPSILSFYPALGVKRDVRSEPELSNYALRGLLSVKYLLTTQKHQEDFLAEADEGWSYYDTRDGYLLYENENYVPMGFTYDYYLTESQYENTIKTTRSNLLMRALVLKDEDAETYSEYLQPLPEERLNDLYYDTYVEDCDARRATASRVFTMTNSGFHAEIDLTRENLVFFSVPYDDGFTAYVNGEQADIVEVDEGLMAVLCPAGTNRVDFVYQADGYSLSRTVTLAAIPVFAVYCGFWWDRKKRKTA